MQSATKRSLRTALTVMVGLTLIWLAMATGAGLATHKAPPKITVIEITGDAKCVGLDQRHPVVRRTEFVIWHNNTSTTVHITFTGQSPFGAKMSLTLDPGDVVGAVVTVHVTPSTKTPFHYDITPGECAPMRGPGPDVIVDGTGMKH
jgi:hypothetical protein